MLFGNRRRNFYRKSTFAENCGQNMTCISPFKCCVIKMVCCVDEDFFKSLHTSPGLLSMWDVWFVLIVTILSCFGGCGYFFSRRRCRSTHSRVSSHPSLRPARIVGPVARWPSRNNDARVGQFNAFVYNGLGVNLLDPVSSLPPPYTEVISQPEFYPINKVELPAYPGTDKPENYWADLLPPGSTVLPDYGTSLPPPYCEPPRLSFPMVRNELSSHCIPSYHGYVDQPLAVPSRDVDNTVQLSASYQQ